MSSIGSHRAISPFETDITYDENHFIAGLEIILEYLNFGNTYEELWNVKNRSRLWCCEYYSCTTFQQYTLGPVLNAHPNLFDFSIPSWNRLLPLPQEDDQPMSTDRNTNTSGSGSGSGSADSEFPTYTEPVLLDDDVVYALVDGMQEESERISPEDTDEDPYGMLRTPLTAGALRQSPLIFYVPELICHLSQMTVEDSLEPETPSPQGVSPSEWTTHTIVEACAAEEGESSAAGELGWNDAKTAVTSMMEELVKPL